MLRANCLLVGISLPWLFAGYCSTTQAQIIPDATLGPESSQLQTQDALTTIEGGASRASTLFHSFNQFNIGESQQVFFANPPGIDTILSRITGTTPSNIDGTLGVLGPADLFLLNPNGIFFGPNAQLSLTGDFTASTAASIQLGNIDFNAAVPNAVPLLTISVSPGLQLGPSAPDRLIQNQATLTLPPQQQLTLDGGTIEQAGQITIPGGTVELRGQTLRLTGDIDTRTADNQFGVLRLSSPTDLTVEATATLTNQALSQALQNNEVVVASDRTLTLIGGLTSTSSAPLTLTAGNDLNLLVDGSGGVELMGNTALQSGRNINLANSLSVLNLQTTPSLTLEAAGDVVVSGSSLASPSGSAELQLTGTQGSLSIQANNLTATETRILTFAEGGSQGPDIDIVTDRNLTLSNGTIGTRAGNGQTTGNIRLQTGQSAQFLSSDTNTLPITGAIADTGTLEIQAAGTVLLRSSVLQTRASGNAGDIDLTARQIILDGSMGQSLIAADTTLSSIGNAGNVTLDATESVRVIGDEPGPFIIPAPEQLGLLGILTIAFGETTIQATAFGSGASGVIEINTDQLSLRDGAIIANVASLGSAVDGTVFSEGLDFSGVSGLPGDIIINANDIQMRGFSAIGTGTIGDTGAGRLQIESDRIRLADGAIIAVSSIVGPGEAGDLIIETEDLVVAGGSVIAANTIGGGNGGKLDITAQSVTIEGISATGTFPSTLLTDVFPEASGSGGELRLQTETLQVLNGGQIRAGTQGSGAAGDLNITADQVTVDGVSSSNIRSTIESQSTSTGAAGSLSLEADQLTISDGAAISTQSQQGSGGDIYLPLEDVLFLQEEGSISATAGIAGTGGDGGQIEIEAGSVVALAEENSDITANAFEGTGGSVSLRTEALIGIAFRDTLTDLSDITASSRFGLDGTVTIEGISDELNPDPVLLPEGFIKPEDRLIAGCLLDEEANFIVTGRGGIPANPAEVLNQVSVWQDPRDSVVSEDATQESTAVEAAAIVEAQGWHTTEQGQIELTAALAAAVSVSPTCSYRQNYIP